MKVGALFKRAVTVLNAQCQCPLMATETLRGCEQTAGGYMETTFGECADNETKETVISNCSKMRTEGTSQPSIGMLSRLLRTETKVLNPLQSVRMQRSEAHL